jgi:hypothetical protein
MIAQPTQDTTMDTSAAINIIFDGPPGPEGPRFIEVETDDGRSIRVGEWQQRQDGNWGLRIAALPPVTPKPEQDADPDPEEDLMQRILAQCVETDLSAVHAAGACHAVSVLLLAQAYNLTNSEQEGK